MPDNRRIADLTVDEFRATFYPTAGHPPIGGPTPDVLPTPGPYVPPVPVVKNWRNVFEIMNMPDPNERRRFTDMTVQELVEYAQLQRELPESAQTKFWPRY